MCTVVLDDATTLDGIRLGISNLSCENAEPMFFL
jgi:hypothetical protein